MTAGIRLADFYACILGRSCYFYWFYVDLIKKIPITATILSSTRIFGPVDVYYT